MRNYWKCESAEDAVAKVVVVTKPGVWDFNEYHYYLGRMDDAVEQYKRWYNCDSVKCGIWKNVKIYVKNGGKWKEYIKEF